MTGGGEGGLGNEIPSNELDPFGAVFHGMTVGIRHVGGRRRVPLAS
jgi:hypothetical protein